VARRFRDVYEQIMADLGGHDALSEGQRQLARRAGMLASLCEGMEALAVQNSDEFDCEKFGVLCDHLGRLLQRLGLERRTKPANGPLTLAEISQRIKAERKQGGSL
jgi:hypothetical protein